MIKYLMIALLLLVMNNGHAQVTNSKCMPQEGYWVVESNVKTPKQSTVWYYTPENILVFSQVVHGKKLKVNKPKTVRQLNGELHRCIVAWKQDVQRNDGLVKLRQ